MKKQYSKELSHYPEKKGETKPRINAHLINDELVVSPPGVANLEENYIASMEKYGEDHKMFGFRRVLDDKGSVSPYEWLTYKQFYIRYQNLASGMINIGVEPGENVGIFMRTRLEWLLADFACICSNVCSVPLYDTLSIAEILYITDETEVSTIFCSQDKVNPLLNSINSTLFTLKTIIVVDDFFEADEQRCKSYGINLFYLEDLERIGRETPQNCASNADLDTVSTICYTSGTTGRPKGVVILHKNFLSAVESLKVMMDNKECTMISYKDIYLSFLPLAHIYERAVVHILISRGCAIAFSRGDVNKIMDDVHDVKSTAFVGVPRLFNRIRDGVLLELSKKSDFTSFLFKISFNSKFSNLKHGVNSHWFWDPIIFSKIKHKLGGKLKVIISGSAPISPDVLDFMKIVFSTNVHQGYGTTETTGPCSLSPLSDNTAGNVGVPLPNTMIKLIDVPSHGYFVTDKPYPRGEICVYGNGIFKEYYKSPKTTAETLDEEGWYHSGDIGMFEESGYLKIIDRKKNLFKLSQGEFIAPELIENIYVNHPIVAQAFVYGDSLNSYLVGIIVPEERMLISALQKTDLNINPETPLETLCKNPKIRRFVVKTLYKWGKVNNLRGYEHIKNVYLEPEHFPIGKIISPSFKLKRLEASKYYKPVIDFLYSETGNY
ncbi:hypothetical protein BB560_003638 [Smittium megazygosporum]|uniref:AMP-dependent synthetase/ligase domain-containing protein n=1 Tax=Smittium megazygosporum TaxID=133381 RepID=A0A2T9ZBH0_9FUNG|nr:hypothetical protein BB560_003638 [Smittium megazygosporum]